VRRTWSRALLVLALFNPSAQAATELNRAIEELAKAGDLFTVNAFLQAAERDERRKVELFLKGGMDANAHNEHGETALSKAAEHGRVEVIRILLRAGADVNARANDGDTALYRCLKGSPSESARPVLAELLAARADVTLKYEDGETALHAAADTGNPEAMKALITAGAEVDARDDPGHTALYACACTGRREEMAVLIAAGADVNARAPDGGTPLMSAALCGQADVVSLLLASKADARLADKNGVTALLNVAHFNLGLVADGHTPIENLGRIAQELLAAGADPNAVRISDGEPPIIEAARHGNVAVIRLLLDAGARLDAKDHYGRTAFQHAPHKPEVIDALNAGSRNK
jgi:cytohesin